MLLVIYTLNKKYSQSSKTISSNTSSKEYIFHKSLIYMAIFDSIKLFLNKEANASQRKLNNEDFESFIDFSFSFNNTVIPFLEQLKNIPKLKGSHFSLFFDAANVWHVDYSNVIDQGNSIRSSTGIAVDLLTPVGPLSFSLAQPISKASGDITESFRFNLGTTF